MTDYDKTELAKLALATYAKHLETVVNMHFYELNDRDISLEAMIAAIDAIEPIIKGEKKCEDHGTPSDMG